MSKKLYTGLKFKKKKRYDLIFSIGEACSCSQSLRKAKMQRASYPLDWVFGSDFLGRIHLLVSGFDRYIEKADLEDTHSNNGDQANLCHVYHNAHNDMGFNHDFLEGVPFDEAYSAVRQKYDRRIARLYANIDAAPRVLVVFIEKPDTLSNASNEDILNGFKQLKEKYPVKTIDLLYFSLYQNMVPGCFSQKQLSENVLKITGNYKHQDPKALPHAIEINTLAQILKAYCVFHRPFPVFLKEQSRNIAIRLIPFKKLRDRMRDKYHV